MLKSFASNGKVKMERNKIHPIYSSLFTRKLQMQEYLLAGLLTYSLFAGLPILNIFGTVTKRLAKS